MLIVKSSRKKISRKKKLVDLQKRISNFEEIVSEKFLVYFFTKSEQINVADYFYLLLYTLLLFCFVYIFSKLTTSNSAVKAIRK